MARTMKAQQAGKRRNMGLVYFSFFPTLFLLVRDCFPRFHLCLTKSTCRLFQPVLDQALCWLSCTKESLHGELVTGLDHYDHMTEIGLLGSALFFQKNNAISRRPISAGVVRQHTKALSFHAKRLAS